jgi:tetratricopeptide (TPR) repeat protein
MKQLALALVVVLAATAPARAQPDPRDGEMSPEAKAHYDRGIAHYAAKEFDAASEELAKAYFIDPRREIVFAWAQARRLAGDCASAIPLYRKYLDSNPPESTAEKVRQHLAGCEAIVGPGGEGPDPTQPQPVAPPVVEPTPDPEPAPLPPAPPPVVVRKRPFYTDVLGGVLVGAGAVGLGVGATFWVMSGKRGDEAASAATYADYERAVHDGEQQRTIGIVGLAAGGALVVGGVLRYALHGGGTERVPDVAIAPHGDGAVVTLGWELGTP